MAYQHLTILGDSITDRRNHYATKWYYDWLAEWQAIPKVTNLGLSGSTIAPPYDPMVQRWQAIPTDTDLLLIYAGVNDFGRDTPLGQFGDQTTATFYGALSQLLGRIKRQRPMADCYFISHVMIGTTFFPAVNHWGYRQIDYEQAIQKVTTAFAVAHISLYQHPELSFANAEQADRLSLDTLHPNDAGHLAIAKVIQLELA
ncbi:SGNH/GDSL hydrolase family protein [Latilactobacillus fuchuensis]|uniref:SGNH/GDSL hydrolase family protein n=1 Tax=Latilactobacillus fuchuensis TaxID=164393 RepID=UPI0020C7D425|nr:SGNH/GDSL hydrolase family protein [Latilactobacillus fuchuensis]MCP8858141.1 SGNH/GDSL hydrolase family protein [Latilactobacillus fuchuensis]